MNKKIFKGSKQMTDEKKNQILELYFCSDKNSLLDIQNIIGYSVTSISVFLDKYFDGEYFYEKKQDFKIYNSKMNY
jgi:hypothetical protein